MRSRTRKEVADYVMEAIRSFGVSVHPSSRIAQMHRLALELEGTIYPDDEGFEILLEADRDFQMLEFIFEHLENAQSDVEFCKLLRKLTSDSALPQLDRMNSDGRNTQFHLFASAMCQAGGMKPVTYAEPDVVCTCENQRIGLAAKRVKNGNQAAKRIPEAISQIEKSSLPGVVALDLTIALNPENARLSVATDDEAYMDLHRTYVNWYLTRLESRIRR